jgi:hypothetical protein
MSEFERDDAEFIAERILPLTLLSCLNIVRAVRRGGYCFNNVFHLATLALWRRFNIMLICVHVCVRARNASGLI